MVEGLVGPGAHRAERVAWLKGGQTDTDCDRPHLREGVFLNLSPYFFGKGNATIGIGFREQKNEFLTTPSGEYIVDTDRTLREPDDFLQDIITSLMSKCIVDLLKMVYVEHNKRKYMIITNMLLQFKVK